MMTSIACSCIRWRKPTLYERFAVEKVSDGESNNSRSTNSTDRGVGGKREQASAHHGKESRRRLA
jgi:hypothetical protein